MHFMRSFMLMTLSFACMTAESHAAAAENECNVYMKGKLGILAEKTFEYGGEVIVRSCKGLSISFLATGETLEAKEVFSKKGYDVFAMNIEFIAQTFVPPPPAEYEPKGWPFLQFPNPATITGDHSDLATGHNGLADTIVFKLNEKSPLLFVKFYETSGPSFTEAAHGGE